MNKIPSILIRYFILLIVAIPNLYIFYFIFTPLTLYPLYFLLSVFFKTSLMSNVILMENVLEEIIPACIAGSAYYLLLILNLSIPSIKIRKRIKMIGLSFGLLLVLNILRIFILSLILVYNPVFFDITHKIFWYLISIIFVVCIWFFEVWFFKIKQIPFYSDLKFLRNLI